MLFLLAGVGVLYMFDPAEPNIYPKCPFLSLTGCLCPGCGTLRALHQLLQGNLTAAVGYNVLTVVSLPFVAYSIGTWSMRELGLRAPRPIFVDHRLIWGLLGVVLLYWALRNLPIEPLTVLAP